MHSKRFTFIETENFQVDLEYNKMYLIIHLPRVTFSKESLVQMQKKLHELYEFSQEIEYEGLWCAIEEDNKAPVHKLAKKLGFVELGSSGGYTIYEFKKDEIDG